jgi:spermidine synthase
MTHASLPRVAGPHRRAKPPGSPHAAAPPAVPAERRQLLGLSLLLFAASGCSALIYEIVWFQLLELVVGSSAISLGILLAIYMGGLCLGSVLLPRVVPRSLHPFRVYAVMEIGIALLAVVVLYEVPVIGRIYTGSGSLGIWSVVLRAAIAGLCLLPPTILMGAGLPAIARWVETTPRGVGWMGLLYGFNIVGGIAGCLLAGFWLLRLHDVATATFFAAAINLGVAAASFLFAGRNLRPVERPEEGPPAAVAPRAVAPVLAVIALSGFAALGGEVVWTRLLSLLLGTTVYTFSIILAVFLTGLGIGSAAGAARARASRHPERDLGLCQLLLAAAVAWAAYAIARSLPYWPIAPSLATSPWITFQLDLVRCLWAILPATVLWGASFPLALAAAAGRGQDPGRLVAVVYAANTIGAIAGALAFSFAVVPAIGTQNANRLLVGLACGAGLVGLANSAWPPWKSRSHALSAAAMALTCVVAPTLLSGVPPVPGELVALGRSVALQLGARDLQTGARLDPHLLYVGEGMNESFAVTGDGRGRLFHVSGKIEASTDPKDMRLQRMLGDLPGLVHPNPRSVLVVGFGSGVTAGTFVLFPSVERIVICEIEPLIPKKVAPFFEAQNHRVISDPRVTMVYDDARHYLLTTREKFDVITSDPIHPWVRGSAALYSREYFDLVHAHLNPGGVVTQWVPLYQSSEATIRGELATFFSTFPEGSVWANNDRGRGYDLVLLGTQGPPAVRLDEIDARLKRPDHAAVARSLAEVGFPSAIALFATYAGRATNLAPWLEGARINRDRDLWLQYQAGLESYTEQEADIYQHMEEYRSFPADLFVGSEALKQRLKEEGGGEAPAH